MILDPDDFADFRRLQSQFMFFISRKMPEYRDVLSTADEFPGLPNETRLPLHQAFRESGPELVSEYLKEDPDNLNQADREVIESWEFAEHGDFYLFKELKRYAVFLKEKESPRAYGVLGLTQPVSEIVPRLPAWIETTLLPFRGKIVCDGMILYRQISFGPGFRKALNESYRLAKETFGVIEILGATPPPKKTATRKRPKKKITAAQRLSRLVNTVHKKMKTVREKEQALKKFEDETEPAFREWFEETFGEARQKVSQLENEVDDLEFILREATYAFEHGGSETGAKAVEAAEAELSERVDDEELTDEDYFHHEAPFADDNVDDEPGEIPDFIFEQIFAAFMREFRGVDIDDLDPEEYQKARDEFAETIGHAQTGDKTAFEKALSRTGADESEDNVSAVKKVYRRLARKIHPDRNPDFGDEAQEIWNELKFAKEALDLNTMLRLETRWRVLQKDTFSEKEEPALKEIQKDLSAELRQLNKFVKEYKQHPMWGVEGDEPPEEFVREVSDDFASDIHNLEEFRDQLKAEIERIKKLKKKKKPSAKKKTPKKKTAKSKPKEPVNVLPEQMTFDF